MSKLDAATRTAIEDCHSYFTDLGLKIGSADSAGEDPDPNIEDSDGLVTFVNTSTNDPPPDLLEEYRKISSILEGLTGVITAAVLTIAGDDEAKRHDPSSWNGPLEAVVKAFFGPYKDEEKKLDKEVVGIEIATEFIQVLLETTVSGGAALDGLRDFLKGQGDTIRLHAGDSNSNYKFACIGMAHEIFEIAANEWLYVPKLSYYFTSFDEETFKVTSACASADHYKFHFDLRNLAAGFRLEYWRENEDFRDEVDDFIDKFTKVNIQNSKNYFGGVFNSKSTDRSLVESA